MAPMYDEDEDLWTGAGLSKQIAAERLAEKQAAQKADTGPSGGERAIGGLKGAMSGAATGATIGSFIPGVGNLVGAGIGALLGGAGGAAGAQKGEGAPSASSVEGAIKTGKGLYDEYKKLKAPGLLGDVDEGVKALSDLGAGEALV